MRVQLDERTERELDAIKKELNIYGWGHANTINFLIKFYNRNNPIHEILEKKLERIPQIIAESLRKVLTDFVTNLFKKPEGSQTG